MWLTNHQRERIDVMPQRTVRARQLPDGHFEFLEPVRIATPEFEVIVNEPEAAPTAGQGYALPVRHLGEPLLPITRDVIYDDLV
jgi:hypothetical protein